MSSIPEFIRTEQNGIEYFTIVATGKCGMSQSGLARACGISRQSIIKLVDDLSPVTKTPSECLEPSADKGLPPVTKAPSEWLEPFLGKDLHLTWNFKKGNVDVVVYRADFCSAVIGHYAGKGRAKALKVLMATTAIGLTSYIQGVTGWLPIALQSSQESRTALDRILDDAKPYKVFFEPLLYEKAVKLMGVKFYWHYCYDFLTMTERCKLNQVRQKTPQGRIDYIHQHISPATIPKLERYLDRLAVLVKQAKTAQHFRTMYQYQFYDNQQKEIDFDAD